MATNPQIGINRTGVATSKALSDSMLQGTVEFPPTHAGDEREISRVREDYSKDAEPIGTVPPPPKLKGMMKTAKQALTGHHPVLLIDKLGERLAFERTGTRLWEALLSKFDVSDAFDGGPTRAQLERISNEEFDHFRLLSQAIVALGGDPTVVTPSADLAATLSKGVLEALVDPRTDLVQSLEAILVAELTDNEAWDMLAELAGESGEDQLKKMCESCLKEEQEHLERVRDWLRAAQGRK